MDVFEKYPKEVSIRTERDRYVIHLEYFIETFREAMTKDKINKKKNNSFLEFLGDGVLSLLVAWDLILTRSYEKGKEIDNMRIEKTSSRKLFEV